MRRNRVVIAVIAIVLAIGAWGYSAYRTHATRTAVVGMVMDAGTRLEPALSAQASGQTDFEGSVRALEKHGATLRSLNTGSMLPLADAADGYLVAVREILKRRAAMQSARERQVKELETLMQHVQADRGRADWPQEAVRLRDSVNREFREYRIATESYASLLETLPGAHAKIAAHVKTMPPADDKVISQARAAALDALARTDENIRKITQLDAYRGGRGARVPLGPRR